jgi:hypothetical protein
MNYRAASRAVSRIATPKNYAASPTFYICYKRRMRGKLRGIHIPRKRDKVKVFTQPDFTFCTPKHRKEPKTPNYIF